MNIIVDLNYPIKDGTEVVFRSPVDCSQVKGLLVNYQDNGPCTKEFALADAHGNNVGDINNLFAENVVVKVILDVKNSMAFVQNADTNAYLEGKFAYIMSHFGSILHAVTGDDLNDLALSGELVPGDLYLITEDNPHDDFVAKGKIFKAKDHVNFSYQMSIYDGGETSTIPILHLPEKYNLVVGDTFELFYKGIMLCKNPYQYNILATCSIGKCWGRKFEATPDAAGTHTLTITVSDDSGNVLDQQTTQLVVAEKGINNTRQLNVLCIGDSLTNGGKWVGEFYRRLTNTNSSALDGSAAPTGDGLANINFVGTCAPNNGACYEGYGGWTFASYLKTTTSSNNYWVSCSHNKTDNDQESIYKDANDVLWQLETIEANRIKFKKYDGVGVMPSSGTLTWVSGGIDTSAITYTAIEQEKGNPFVYNGAVDFAAYCEDLGISTIHHCYILLGWNNTTTEEDTYKAQAKQFIDLLLEFNPDMKIVLIGLQIPSLDGCANNYGAKGTLANFRALQEYVFNMDKLYKEIADEYANVESINLSGQFDTDYNCMSDELPVNSRNATTVTTQTNGVHPSTQGQYQIADAAYRKFYEVYERMDLLGLDKRTAVFRDGQLTAAATAKEMSPDKIYYFDGRGGASLGSGYSTSLNGLELTKDSIKFTADATGSGVNLNAYGLSVPLALEDGKTYTISARRNSNSAHALNLLTFAKGDNDMWTYEKFNAVSHVGNNVYSRTVTTEAGKGYALLFTLTSADNNVLCEFTNISVKEAE